MALRERPPEPSAPAGQQPRPSDAALVAALADGDEATFAGLVTGWGPTMLRMARAELPSASLAEEVVQEAWLVVLRRLSEFEGRSSLRSWVLGIVVNVARARARRERRCVPFSSQRPSDEADGAVDADRFLPPDHDRWPLHWALGPVRWPTPEERLLDGETRRVILEAVAALPPAQRLVLTLRDIEGWPPEETTAALQISAGNQRVLLHRARSRVRLALEDYFSATEATT